MFVFSPAPAARRAAGAVCLFGALLTPAWAQTPQTPPASGTTVDAVGDPAGLPATGTPQTTGGLGAVPGQVPPAATTTPGMAPVLDRIFATGAGMLISPIKADRVKDFEAVMLRLHQALARSANETRRKQAAGWRLFRAAEPGPAGSVIYVSFMAPAVPKADYAVGKILLEAFPLDEVQDLHERYTSAFAGAQTILSLSPVTDFAQPVLPAPAGRE